MLTTKPVKLYLGAAGYCTHPEFLTLRGGSFRPVRFPAGFACILHPDHGPILLDTGYSSRFFEETARSAGTVSTRMRSGLPTTFGKTETVPVSAPHAE